MAELLAALAASDFATALRMSRWLYAGVNTAHVLGIALLVGSILPLDLRFLGLWGGVPREAMVRVLAPVAATGFVLAITAGALLFATRAPEYALLPVFQVKMALVVLGAVSTLILHARYGARLHRARRATLARTAALSMICWLGALICGRMIAFAGN